ncbi:MAG: M20/M25/M40 family metallo-hydrolase [Armatimonadota bacterium]|nr:M20/M25/M40 family metallo-hydrolase [Armatimonadota bacterium]MDR7488525.1 M20/M25/M40 family metallo-hydrolase [Armatimonadota bacterium]MDR7573784.1 M20/M25/M40 family metallo-hydrolase [Armatimonadota bacterium]MDR7586531.1 M20/M25/M40 family metallo-hydrolase [Armatimonadota bacterium]
MFDLVKTLTELDGPTGYEDPVQEWLAGRWTALGLAVQRTPIGNLMAHLGGEGPRLLIGAHADEISFRVKSIDDRGFLWLTSGRGRAEERLPELVPLGYPARVLLDGDGGTTVEGIFATVTGHVMTRRQRREYERRAYDWLDFYVDVGVRTRAEAEALGLHPGLPVINAVTTRRVGRYIVGKAMDDRAGLAIMTALAERVDRRRLHFDVWLTSMVMEEIGMVGARPVAAGFDAGLIVEVGPAGDIPLVDPRSMPVALGKGPILVHKDLAMPYDRRLTAALARAAAAAEVPVQHATFQNFTSDGAEWVQEGVPTAMVAFPCRYTHSPFETVDEDDLRRTVDWLEAFLTTG